MSSVSLAARKPGLLGLVDWKLVAAVGLPLWAFLVGFVVAEKSAPPPPDPAPVEVSVLAPPVEVPASPVETIPMPREVVVRTEVAAVPVPVLVQGEPVAALSAPAEPAEFRLPPSEVMAADRCQTFDTKIRFRPGLPEAAQEAKQSKKMVLVLHISGNFDDPGFT